MPWCCPHRSGGSSTPEPQLGQGASPLGGRGEVRTRGLLLFPVLAER